MTKKSTLKLSTGAVTIAALIIAVALIANPGMLPPPVAAQSSFVVMLTDPPTVPAGTTQLNLTYTGLAIHITYPNGSAEWLPVGASGTVNLFSLINVTRTIAATTIPLNSTVDKVQFTIANVAAEINAQRYNVTALSDTFVVKVSNSVVNQTLSGVLVDFNPTLVQIQASDVNGSLVNYYVLVPSANAVIINGVTEDHAKVGTIVQLGENNRVKLVKVQQEFNSNVTIVSATLGVNGNTTSLSVTLKNDGDVPFKIFGLTLNGEFNATRDHNTKEDFGDRHDSHNQINPDTIPVKISGTSLTPILGTSGDHKDDQEYYDKSLGSLTLQPGETTTLSYTGIITLNTEDHHSDNAPIVITPVAGSSYILKLMGEGFQTFTVTAQP